MRRENIWSFLWSCCWILCALLSVAFSQQTPDFESLLASAQQAQARGDFEAAAGFYRKAVNSRPDIAELHANLGLMYYQTGRDQEAIDSFLHAIRLKPDLFVPNLFLGLDYLRLKRPSESIPYLKLAALSKSVDVQTYLALGQAYAAIGKTREAIASYSQALQLDSENAETWFHLGVSYLEQVEANARILLARHKQSGYLHALVADTFTEQRAFVQAMEAYKATLDAAPFPSGIHASYAFVLLNQHDLAGARRELSAEMASNHGSLMGRLCLARLSLEELAPAEAAKEIANLWKTDASFLNTNAALFFAGISQPRLSAFEQALEERRSAGEIPEEVVSLFTDAGDSKTKDFQNQLSSNAATSSEKSTSKAVPDPAALYAHGRYEECSDALIARFTRLVARDLRLLVSCAYPTARYRAAFDAAQKLALNSQTEAEGLYWETKSSQKLAIAALAHAGAMDSNSPTLHVLLGDVYRQRKYYPDAEQEYRKGLALKPEDTGALLGLSLTLLADSEIDEAYRVADTALKKDPHDPEVNAVMGEILSARHDFTEAEPYLKKALKTKPELIPHVHALLGRVYAETNRTEQAIAEMKLGLADDKDGRLHFQIARLYMKVGDQNSAKQAFQISEQLRREGLTRAAVAMQQGENNPDSQ